MLEEFREDWPHLVHLFPTEGLLARAEAITLATFDRQVWRAVGGTSLTRWPVDLASYPGPAL